ncbi:hypothetical protein KG091_03160 [Carnobacteriaceae bacterium zg-ZUI78]|uniref:hypothetical protein n=1 Tax=Granulicatella sp. zg-84 TaxID=2678503 RepID=UPI0013C01FBD|nr:hypothetical protein [Granulicatella sp. zg-84]MBS4750074.1 hypothetical protein [Carnobacteriaceae bacterium zg-ZUI78]NEW65770.1 hypothetical protein [Granulicatella sp. zg-84]QMI86279.1 hypothetical protein H1220_02685 [Carnobacteriaceae bacterium zg-84]
MKKIIKYATALSTIVLAGTAYQYKKQLDKQHLCDTILSNAKTDSRLQGHIVGSFINMTKEYSDVFDMNVFVGGVTTTQYTYDFVADAQTGALLALHQQIRL